MVSQIRQSATCNNIPELNISILPSTGEELSIRTESNTSHPVCMSWQVTADTSAHIPQAHCIIFAPTGNHSPVRTKYDRPNPFRAVAKCTHERSIIDIPDTDLTIIRSCRHQSSIWTPCCGQDIAEAIRKNRCCKVSVCKIDPRQISAL